MPDRTAWLVKPGLATTTRTQSWPLTYGFINFVSALRADAVRFNPAYHLVAFFDELPRLLTHFPDYNELWTVDALCAKSRILPLGLDLARFDAYRPAEATAEHPLVLWDHRWEYDKAPETFFHAVYAMAEESLDFGLLLLGHSFRNHPDEFLQAHERLRDRVVHLPCSELTSQTGRDLGQHCRLLL